MYHQLHWYFLNKFRPWDPSSNSCGVPQKAAYSSTVDKKKYSVYVTQVWHKDFSGMYHVPADAFILDYIQQLTQVL